MADRAPPPDPPRPDSPSPPNPHPDPPQHQQQQQQSDHSQQSAFSTWGLDRLHIASLLSSPDAAVDPPPSAHTPPPDLSAAAANIAQAATTEWQHASQAAQHTFDKAAHQIGKGWGTLNTFLDDMLAPDSSSSNPTSLPDDTSQHLSQAFHRYFPHLDPHDQVVDHFECALIQKYRCYLNNATPEKVFILRGTLYVTTTHIAMYVTDNHAHFSPDPFGITIALKDVAKFQKGAKSMLRLLTLHHSSYIFAQFQSDTKFTAAITLLEHMAAASQPLAQPNPAPPSAPDNEPHPAENDTPASSPPETT